MNEENIKQVSKLRGLVKKAVEFRAALRDKEYINNEAHMEGKHWDLADVGSDSPFIVKSDINHLKNAVTIRLGSLYASEYFGILKPKSPDDVENIETLNMLYKNEWNLLNLDELIKKAIKASAIFDLGYIKFNYNPDAITGGTNTRKEGKIEVDFVETASIYLDPSATSFSNCDYMVERMSLTKEWIKLNKPEWYSILKNKEITDGAVKDKEHGSLFVARDYTTNQSNLYNVDAVYEKVSQDIEVPIASDIDISGNMDMQTGLPNMPEQIMEEQLTEKVRVTRVKISYICNDVILEVNDNYPFDDFPIVPMIWEEIPQCPYGIPLLRGLTIPQKIANLIESATNNVVMHYTVPTWLISDESGLDVEEVAQLINALGVVWKVNNLENAIKQLEPPKLNNDIVSMGATFVGYIQQYAGATAAYQGNIGTSGSTAEGSNLAIGRATIIDNDPLTQIQNFVERLTKMLIKFMTRYYVDKPIYIRKEENGGKYSFEKFMIDAGFSDINYDFYVDLGSKTTNDKNRNYNLMKEIYQMQLQYKDSNPIINVADIIKSAQLDNFNEMYARIENSTEEALNEKASLIVQLMQIGQTTTPNGDVLIPAEQLQDGIIDVLNDDNDLTIVQEIINTYQEYQSAITDFNSKVSMMQNNSMGMQQPNIVQNTQSQE